MAYTTIPTFTDTVASTSDFNTYIRDNQRALKDPPSQNFEANAGANYTTSSTTYADIDASLSLSITTTGGDVLVSFSGCFAHDAGGGGDGFIDLAVDGVRIGTDGATDGRIIVIEPATNAKVYSFSQLITGLSAGSHTFALQWKVTVTATTTLYAGAGTANYDVHPQFWVRELT